MPRLSAVRARHAALVGIIYHTCLPLFTLNSPSLHSKIRCQVSVSVSINVLSLRIACPLYIGAYLCNYIYYVYLITQI